jgi:uncharacterized phage protein gp47/JayE
LKQGVVILKETYETILARMAEKFAEESGCQVAENSEIAQRMQIFAAEVFSAYAHMEWIKRQMFPQTAQREQLTLHAQQRGLERKNGTKSFGEILFSRSSKLPHDVVVPKGTICAAKVCAGEQKSFYLRFQTTEQSAIKAGELQVLVPARAAKIGEESNVLPNTVSLIINPPAGIEAATNPQKFEGGTNKESDEELRARLLESYKNIPNGTNCAFYEKIAMSFPEVHSANVIPRERGPGTVDLYLAAKSGVPTKKVLENIQAKINQLREINVDAKVHAATLLNLNICLQIEPAQGYVWEEIKSNCQKAVNSYFSALKVGESIKICALNNAIFATQGVENFCFGPQGLLQDKPIDAKHLAVLKNLEITQK